jgi:tripartite-type tricarboxylate transporter receptor subunit TctC
MKINAILSKTRLVIVAAIVACTISSAATAESYPSKPITLLVGYGTGGPVDFLARTLANHMSKSMGQPLIVISKPGANERIATGYLRSQPADGYLIQLVVVAFATNPILFKSLPYDSTKDFTPVIHLANSYPILSVNSDSDVRDFRSLVQKAKANPGVVSFGSPGMGTNNHLTMELLSSLAGVKFNHIPYNSDANTVIDLLGGRLDASMNAMPSVIANIQAGRLRAIGVSSSKRIPQLPDVPTFKEQGYAAISPTWFGAIVRAGTPPEIVNQLNKVFNAALELPEVRDALSRSGLQTIGGTPKQFADLIRSDTERWARIIRERGVEVLQ